MKAGPATWRRRDAWCSMAASGYDQPLAADSFADGGRGEANPTAFPCRRSQHRRRKPSRLSQRRGGRFYGSATTTRRWPKPCVFSSMTSQTPLRALCLPMASISSRSLARPDAHQRNVGGMLTFLSLLPDLHAAARSWLAGHPQHFTARRPASGLPCPTPSGSRPSSRKTATPTRKVSATAGPKLLEELDVAGYEIVQKPGNAGFTFETPGGDGSV